jgi:hypothetical protein
MIGRERVSVRRRAGCAIAPSPTPAGRSNGFPQLSERRDRPFDRGIVDVAVGVPLRPVASQILDRAAAEILQT